MSEVVAHPVPPQQYDRLVKDLEFLECPDGETAAKWSVIKNWEAVMTSDVPNGFRWGVASVAALERTNRRKAAGR